MLDYTIAAGKRVWRNIRIASLILNLTTQIVAILYLTYILAIGSGILAINCILLAVSILYLLFFCITLKIKEKRVLKRRVKIIFKWSKRVIKLVNLATMLYAIITTKDSTSIDILLALVSIGFWALDILLEIISIVVRSWGLLLFEGLKTDFETVTAPINATKNFFKKVTGQEVAAPPPPTKRRLFLEKLVESGKIEKLKNKLRVKEENAQRKKEAKAEKKAAKEAEKQAKRNPAPSVEEETAFTSND